MKCVVAAILAVLTGLVSGIPARPAVSQGLPAVWRAGQPSPNVLYIAARHLWLRPVDGGPARGIATPWPVATKDGSTYSSFQWSPDGRRVALDDASGRLAVINLTTGRITVLVARRCAGSCSATAFAWSPNSRYLAFLQPGARRDRAILRVWDSSIGRSNRILGNLAAYVAYPEWSHDSTRVGVEVGAFDVMKDVFPEAVAVDLAGHVVHLGKGMYLSWSSDDRLVGIIEPNFCGANTCDENEMVRSSAGGPPVLLARHSSSLFDNPVWAPQVRGYAFDRWLLDASGHPTRRLAGPHERILSWRKDGSRLALQTYYPYQGTPDVLYLSTPARKRTRFYTDGWNAGCGACSKDVYGIAWGRGDLFAFSTPTYPTPKNVTVYPKVFVSSTAGGTLHRVGIASTDIVKILGLVDGDRTLVVQAGRVIYRYDTAAHRLVTIVSGVLAGYATAALDPVTVGAMVLQWSADAGSRSL